jgi:hypothetical protein
MPSMLWQDVVEVANIVPNGYARLLVELWEFYSTMNETVDGSLAYAVEKRFWEGQIKPGSRHAMFYEVFGHGPLGWNCIKSKSSFTTLRTVAQFVCLNLPYFWEASAAPCCLCNSGSQSLLHLLVECPATTMCCSKHLVPLFPAFLRQFLVSRTGM